MYSGMKDIANAIGIWEYRQTARVFFRPNWSDINPKMGAPMNTPTKNMVVVKETL